LTVVHERLSLTSFFILFFQLLLFLLPRLRLQSASAAVAVAPAWPHGHWQLGKARIRCLNFSSYSIKWRV
jgi:hypothetical protein